MMGDYKEYAEAFPQQLLNTWWTDLLIHNTQVIPPGTYIIQFNWIYQNSIGDTGYAAFQPMLDGVPYETPASYLQTYPDPGTVSRETASSLLQFTTATTQSHEIRLQGVRVSSPASYARAIRMKFYKDDTSRSNWNFSEVLWGSASTTYADVISTSIDVPTGGANYYIWLKTNWYTQPTRNAFYRGAIDGVGIPETEGPAYNTGQAIDRGHCWTKVLNCLHIDEGIHSLSLQAKTSGSGGGIGCLQQTIRAVRFIS
jgi:hypothetical protein